MSEEKKMTVREVAEVLKCDVCTIHRHVKELFPEIVENGKTTYLNEAQVTVILEKIKVPKASGRHVNLCFQSKGLDTSMSRELRIELLTHQLMEEFRLQNEELRAKEKELLIEVDRSDEYWTIVKYNANHRKKWDGTQRQQLGKKAAGICRERGIQLKLCSNEAFNPVYSYPVEVLDEIVKEWEEENGYR